MQSKNVNEMSDYVIDEMCDFFQLRVKDFVIRDFIDDVNHKSFDIEFNAYDYFPVVFNYDMGRIGCSFKELEEELELRITDKFLKSRGSL